LHAVSAVELHAFAGDVAEFGQYDRGGVEERVCCSSCQFGQGWAWAPAAVGASAEEAVYFEAYCQSVRGRPG
jgi:hypothetical protein